MKVITARSVFLWEKAYGSKILISPLFCFAKNIPEIDGDFFFNQKSMTRLAINLYDALPTISAPWVAQLGEHLLSSSNNINYW